MTVVSSSNNITFAGDGVQILFDFNFKIFKEEDLAAVIRDSSGVERTLVNGSDFKLISGPGEDSGGRVSYPVSGIPLQTGESITFYRDISYSQELELVDNDPFSAELLNEAFDRGVMRDQQLQEQVARSLKYDISTPSEEQLMPQEFMRNVIDSRDAATLAKSEADLAKLEAQVAQSAAEVARSGAESAQTLAEYAKDAAEAIAWGELTNLRSDKPVLVGPAAANEGEIVEISIADYVQYSTTSYDIDVTGFGSAELTGSVISWTLGTLDVDTTYSIKVVRRRVGEIYSETATHQVLVKNILASNGPTIVFSNDNTGWPGATIDADGIHVPADSVGATNSNQIISAKMEIEVASGKLTVLDGTTDKLFKTSTEIKKADRVKTEVGDFYVGDVSDNSIVVPHVVSDPSTWRGTGDGVGAGITVVDGLTSASPAIVWNTDLTGEFDFEWLVPRQASSTYFGVISSTYAHTGNENYMFNLTNEQMALEFAVFVNTNWYYPLQSTYDQSGPIVDGVTKMRMTRDVENICSLYIDDALIATETHTGTLRFWASTHVNPVKLKDFKAKGKNDPNYSCSIDLPSAPTKAYLDPLQGEKITVDASSDSTHLVSPNVLEEGKNLETNLGDIELTSVVFNEGTLPPIEPIEGSLIYETSYGRAGEDYNYVAGSDNRPRAECAMYNSATINPIRTGRFWSTKKVVQKAIVTSSNDFGFVYDVTDASASLRLSLVGIAEDGTTWETIATKDIVNSMALQSIELSNPSYTKSHVKHSIIAEFTSAVANKVFVVSKTLFYSGISGKFTADITSAGLSEAPAYASRKVANVLNLGIGGVGEYLGPEIELELVNGNNIIPTMTEETTDGFTITASTNSGALYAPHMIADGNKGPDTQGWVSNTDAAVGQYVNILGSTAKTVAKMTMSSGYSYYHRKPTGFTLTGRLAGGAWQELLAVTGLATWPDETTREFDVPNLVSCDEWRITVTEKDPLNAGEDVSIAELELFEAQPSTALNIVTTSIESQKDKIAIDGGSHNNLLCDGVLTNVASVSEEAISATDKDDTHNGTRTNGWSIGTGGGDKHAALRFPATKEILEAVTFHNGNTAIVNFTLKLYSDNNGTPDQLLYTGPTVERVGVGDINFVLAVPQALVVGTNYWLVLYHNSGGVDLSTTSDTVESPYMMWRGTDFTNTSEDLTTRGLWKHSLTYRNVKYKQTSTLVSDFGFVPTSVAIPDRKTLSATDVNSTVLEDKLLLSSEKIMLPDNADLKQLALAARAPIDMCFTDGKIYIQETL